MSKRIIYCADGTWEDSTNNSNVHKMFKAALVTSDQVTFYDNGLGSDGRPIQKMRGGAYGSGIDQKIKEGYTKIAQSYKPGDELFLFGWSRGAYTVRSLAGMICECGLPTKPFDSKMVDDLFFVYRNPQKKKSLFRDLKEKYGLCNVTIKFIGVWDTVGSLGHASFFGKINPIRYGFLDTDLHPNILNAYHALSIDERRKEFPPTLWALPSPPVKGQVLEQVWFAGCHADIGGSKAGLPEISFKWLAEKAKENGMQIDPNVFSHYENLNASNALGQIHESWSIKCGLPKTRTIPKNAVLSNSVALRCKYDPSYRPKNLTFTNDVLNSSYTIRNILNSDGDL